MTQPAFDAPAEARLLMREAKAAALATLTEEGFPFASLVTLAPQADGRPILLMSDLAVHTRNLKRDPRASLLISGGPRGVDPLAGPRLTLVGRMERLEDRKTARRRFLARHASAEMYVDFGDFGFWELFVENGHLVAGFGRIAPLRAAELVADLAGAEAVLDLEEEAIGHMNEDHADAVRLYAVQFLGEADGDWRVVGLDPFGMDLALGERVRRFEFPERINHAGGLRVVLKRLADEARGKSL